MKRRGFAEREGVSRSGGSIPMVVEIGGPRELHGRAGGDPVLLALQPVVEPSEEFVADVQRLG